ncbi:MAG: hypothetical protein AAGA85_14185 [Bacteroidota bacterium]
MFRSAILVLIALVFWKEESPNTEEPITSFFVGDSIRIDVQPMRDSAGILDGYWSEVFTPICETDKCYAVVVNFYWDLMGRFQRYDTVPGEALTKLDHLPFEPEDYQKLQEILSNADSPLRNYAQKELVRDTRSSEIDGMTGATIQEVRDNVIPGAVYSCHTLWHIAHGNAVDSLQQATTMSWSDELVAKMTSRDDPSLHYFLIQSFLPEDFNTYREPLLSTIPNSRGYYAKNAIEALPTDVLHLMETQVFFAEHLPQFNYFTQVALLKKLDSAAITEPIKASLVAIKDDRDSYKNQLINQLIGEQNDF